MKKNGFTLIEILAVIFILGILMIIAVPSVTNYINDSRKTSFTASVSKYIDIAMDDIASLEYSVRNKDYTYYIPTSCLQTENISNESPFGEFVESYVVVTYNNGSNDFYYTGFDKTGHGILLTYRDLLDESKVKTDISSLNKYVGVGDRPYIYIYSDNCNKSRERFDAGSWIEDKGSLE